MGQQREIFVLRKKMRSAVFVLSLAIIYSTASPINDDIVPEEQLFALDDELVEAQQKIDEMLSSGTPENACRKLVTDARKNVEENVKKCQKVVDGLPKGESCPSRGQDAVKAATEQKNKADKHVVFCKTQVTKAEQHEVDFGSRTYSSLTYGKCSSFYASTSYTTAKITYQSAVSAHVTAVGAASQAAESLKGAIAAAEKEKHKCLCKVKGKHEETFKKHSSSNAANQKAWNFACKVECVLDRKSTCTCSAAPMCQRAKVTSEVMEADCTEHKKEEEKEKVTKSEKADKTKTKEERAEKQLKKELKDKAVQKKAEIKKKEKETKEAKEKKEKDTKEKADKKEKQKKKETNDKEAQKKAEEKKKEKENKEKVAEGKEKVAKKEVKMKNSEKVEKKEKETKVKEKAAKEKEKAAKEKDKKAKEKVEKDSKENTKKK